MTKQTNRTRTLVEAALLVALATALSLFKLVDLPYGGSVTLASMLPILLLSYRRGVAWGVAGGAAFSLLQQLLGLNNLTYFTTWQSVVAVMLLDYFAAFTLIGIGGIFRRAVKNQSAAIALGALTVCVLRYACHVVAGATVWAGLSIPDSAALLYSIGYNATYMLPETVVTVAIGAYLGSVIDFTRERPVRIQKEQTSAKTGRLSVLAGLVAAAAAVVDAVLVLANVQNPETGAFDITQLAAEPFMDSVWLPVTVISVVCALLAAVLLLVDKKQK